MKKYLILIILVVGICFSLVACGNAEEQNDTDNFATEEQVTHTATEEQVTYTATEEYAISCVNKVKSYCISPSSFELNGDVLVFTMDEPKLRGAKICCFNYSAQNQYGVLLADNALFCDWEFWGSINDVYAKIKNAEKERQYMTSDDEKIASLEKQIKMNKVLQEVLKFQLNVKVPNQEIIPEKTIIDALN